MLRGFLTKASGLGHYFHLPLTYCCTKLPPFSITIYITLHYITLHLHYITLTPDLLLHQLASAFRYDLLDPCQCNQNCKFTQATSKLSICYLVFIHNFQKLREYLRNKLNCSKFIFLPNAFAFWDFQEETTH